MVLEHRGRALIVSGGDDGALHSWRLDNTPGELQEPGTREGAVLALAGIVHDGVPLVVSADSDWRVRIAHIWGSNALAALTRPAARTIAVRDLALGSLEIVLLIPLGAGLAAAAVTAVRLAKLLDAIRRIALFMPKLRLERTQIDVERLRAELAKLEGENLLAEAQARHRRDALYRARWEVERVTLTDGDEPFS